MAILKAKIDGVWVDLQSGQDEVYVGANDPGAGFDLWYDTDDPGTPVTPRHKTLSVGIPAMNIPNASTLLATLDFGVSAVARTIDLSLYILGTATTATAIPRILLNINAALRKQVQGYVNLNTTATVELNYHGEVAAGPCVVTVYCQNYAAGTFNLPADISFCGLVGNTRWDS